MSEPLKDLSDWRRPPAPGHMVLVGRHVQLEPLSPEHAPALHAATAMDDSIWRYLAYGPFCDAAAYAAWIESVAGKSDPCFFAIFPEDALTPAGVAALMRVDVANGAVEVGHICLSPSLQRTVAATEAILLLAEWAFDAGYRRFEWKCDSGNAPSRRAAARYGFAYEGVFRQHMIVKGRNRDTAWFAMTDDEWPELRAAHRRWIAPANFDAEGRQRERLGDLTAPVRARVEAAADRARP